MHLSSTIPDWRDRNGEALDAIAAPAVRQGPHAQGTESETLATLLTPGDLLVIAIPDRDRDGRRVDQPRLIHAIRSAVRSVSGGTTVIRGDGDSVLSTGRAVAEDVAFVCAILPPVLAAGDLRAIQAAVLQLATEGTQEVVLVAVLPLRSALLRSEDASTAERTSHEINTSPASSSGSTTLASARVRRSSRSLGRSAFGEEASS